MSNSVCKRNAMVALSKMKSANSEEEGKRNCTIERLTVSVTCCSWYQEDVRSDQRRGMLLPIISRVL